MSVQINIVQRGNSYFVRRQTKTLWGIKTDYLSLHFLPNLEWRPMLDSWAHSDDLKRVEAAYELVVSGDKVIK